MSGDTDADRLMHDDAQRAQRHHEKYREVEEFVESAIGLAVDEAQRIVMEGVEAAVGPPRLIKAAQNETTGKRTFHVRATSPTSHVEVEVTVDVTGINKLADDATKLEYLLDVRGMVTVPHRRSEHFEDSYDPSSIGHPQYSSPAIRQLIQMALRNVLDL